MSGLRRTVTLLLLLAAPAFAQSRRKFFIKIAEHVSIGAGVEVGMSTIAGGSAPRKVAVGLTSAALVAGFKEGSDAIAGRDTKKQAAIHALEIAAGAGLMAAVRH